VNANGKAPAEIQALRIGAAHRLLSARCLVADKIVCPPSRNSGLWIAQRPQMPKETWFSVAC